MESVTPAKRQKFSGSNNSPTWQEIQAQRQNLPIFPARKRLLHELRQNDSSIVIGETASGKTTQIPQYIYETGMHRNLMIACTQPRRVAAITVAQRVSQEKGQDVGALVGYCVRFDDTTSEKTKIKYMTDGMLLRESILDPLLKRYAVVLLDEAHERTIHTDVLFGVVKSAQHQRRQRGITPLKIIVMSATMDVDQFSRYFNDAPVLYLEGRQFPVKMMYTCETQSDYQFSALSTIFQIHQEAPPRQDILVFLTGQEEIESMVTAIRDVSKELSDDSSKILALPMYASLPQHLQLRVFQNAPKGTRKVIVATNIAETSVTIRNIKFVVDTGKVKAKTFNPRSGLDMLKVQKTSKAQAWQRSGRAGRESAGTCYRLYTEEDYEALPTNTRPEILRCNLCSVTLQLLALGIKNIAQFDFMDKPSTESIQNAIVQLKLLGAIENTDDNKLTPLGRKMAAFPLDPSLAKVILKAVDFDCLEEILTIVSMLSVESIMHSPASKREEASAVQAKFISHEGDHLTYLNVYRSYKGVSGSKNWCHENFINARNMKTACDIRGQLRDICMKQDMQFKSCGRETAVIRECLAHGFFMNAAELQKDGKYISVASRQPVAIHPSSAIFRCKPSYVIYNELVKTSACYMRNVCVVDPDWIFEAAPNYFKTRPLHT
ncbi:unnamed protein product [Owenia fusiformis]|uniref:RNA helicase n=1 Tax=Owenia fusiformis TaxID=6347 RepID=A0A8J1TCS8_OWEFU|nr:unnamed protein product [Owenia fusiformis]